MTALEIAEQLGQGQQKKSGTGWMVPCPSHADNTPSLWVNDGDNGGIVLKCHAECAFEDIVAASGIERDEFFADRSDRDIDDTWTPKGDAIDKYPYNDETGRLRYMVVRLANKEFIQWRPDASAAHGRAWNLNGVTRLPYRLPEVLKGIEAGHTIVICEGEKDVHTFVRNGFVATCNSGGAGKFLPEFASYFKGAKVVVVPDQDSPGKSHGEQVATILHDVVTELRVVDLPGLTGEKGCKDATDWFEAGNARADFIQIARSTDLWVPSEPSETRTVSSVASVTTPEDDVWESPVPLDTVSAIPPFPIDTLPSWMGGYIAALAESTQTPTDLGAMLGLSAVAATAGGLVDIRINRSWRETLNLWSVSAMESGEAKSPVYRAITAPLYEFEKELLEASRSEIIEARTRHDAAKARAKKALDEAGNKTDRLARLEAEDNAKNLAIEADEMYVPAEPQLIVEDVTSEYLGQVLAEQEGRIALFSDEGGPFAAMAGRYEKSGSKGGPKGSLDIWLKGYDGTAWRSGRVQRGRDFVESPCITVAMTVQPVVLRQLESELRERGMLARFCLTLPVSKMGWRNMRAEPVAEALEQAWQSNLIDLARTLREQGGTLHLSPEAREALTVFREWMEPKLQPTGDLAAIKDWSAKFAGRLARIAGHLHLAENFRRGWDTPVTLDTMERAIRIGRYLLAHTMVAFDLIGSDDRRERARTILRFLGEHQHDPEFPKLFTRRDVMKRVSRSQLPDAEHTQPSLDLLEDFRWIRQVSKTNQGTVRYEMRPDLHATLATVTTLRDQTLASVSSVSSVTTETTVGETPVVTIDRNALSERVGRLDPESEAASLCSLYDIGTAPDEQLVHLVAYLDSEEGAA